MTLNPAQSAEFRARAPKIGDLTQSAESMKFALKNERLSTKSKIDHELGGLNDKEHRYFGKVPNRAKNIFSRAIRVGLYNPDAILGFEGFLVFEILKGRETGRGFQRPQLSTFFKYCF